MFIKTQRIGTSLAIQELRLCASNARGMGSVPGGRTKIPHGMCSEAKNKLIKIKEKNHMIVVFTELTNTESLLLGEI